jgi:hypothetical protein
LVLKVTTKRMTRRMMEKTQTSPLPVGAAAAVIARKVTTLPLHHLPQEVVLRLRRIVVGTK